MERPREGGGASKLLQGVKDDPATDALLTLSLGRRRGDLAGYVPYFLSPCAVRFIMGSCQSWENLGVFFW